MFIAVDYHFCQVIEASGGFNTRGAKMVRWEAFGVKVRVEWVACPATGMVLMALWLLIFIFFLIWAAAFLARAPCVHMWHPAQVAQCLLLSDLARPMVRYIFRPFLSQAWGRGDAGLLPTLGFQASIGALLLAPNLLSCIFPIPVIWAG